MVISSSVARPLVLQPWLFSWRSLASITFSRVWMLFWIVSNPPPALRPTSRRSWYWLPVSAFLQSRITTRVPPITWVLSLTAISLSSSIFSLLVWIVNVALPRKRAIFLPGSFGYFSWAYRVQAPLPLPPP